MVEVNFAKADPADTTSTTREENPNAELPKIVFPQGDGEDDNNQVSEQSA